MEDSLYTCFSPRGENVETNSVPSFGEPGSPQVDRKRWELLRSLEYQNRTTSWTIGPRDRKTLALSVMLALCLVTTSFGVLATGEAWGAEQPPQTTQPGTLHSTTMINGKVAEPVAGAKPPAETPPVVVENPPVETPPEQKTPLPPTNETPPVEEPSPPPVDPAPSTPEPSVPTPPAPDPEPSTPQPAPQWFAVVTTDGEVVESDPVHTSWSTTDPEQTPDVAYPTPGSAAPVATPVEDSGSSSVPSTSPDAWPLGSAADEAMPTDQRATEPFLGPVASDQVAPQVAPQGVAALLPEPVRGLVPGSVISRDTAAQPAPTMPAVFEKSPVAALMPTVPASVVGALRLPSSLGTNAASAVGTVRSMAASVSSATMEFLGSLAGVSPSTTTSSSSTDATDETQEQQPSEGTPQPAPAPVAPPTGGGSFSPFTGGGQLSNGGGFAPLLVGILALLGTILLGRNFRTYLFSCDMPKPSSALLGPLERPG